jgi:hypothetical protein
MPHTTLGLGKPEHVTHPCNIGGAMIESATKQMPDFRLRQKEDARSSA